MMKNKLIKIFFLLVCTIFILSPFFVIANGDNTTQEEIQFVCVDNGIGLSVVDVLQATNEHDTFLKLLSEYDPEGFSILSDPQLSDKTIWAPTDDAFLKINKSFYSLSDNEIKAILGYHITPPRRIPDGSYPIITPQFLADKVEIIHQTRTGILTGSDQRIRTKVYNGRYMIEEAFIMPTAWCTQSGSGFSINAVIMNAASVSFIDKMIYVVFYKYWYLSVFLVAILLVSSLLYFLKKIKK